VKRLVAALAIAGCGRPAAGPAPEPTTAPAPEVVDAAPAVAPVVASAPALGEAVVLVTDPAALAAVEAAGGSFAALLGARWPSIAAVIESDVDAIAAADPRAGVGIRGHPHRLFDTAWLERGSLELVGVVNRLDRLGETPGACGDVRLIYRLRYRAADNPAGLASRLPMTLAAILAGPRSTDCREAARRWKAPAGAAIGAWLTGEGGPLGPLSADRVERVLTNVQAVRWPAGIHPDLGGHAEYLFRELVPGDGARMTPAPLPAVPDVARIRASRELRAALRAWARDPATVRALDRGVATLPAALRASMSEGFTPRGFSRRGNRPFRSLLDPRDLAGVDLSEARLARSPAALIRRMDELTCAGCHQARAVAGFHLLGEDPPAIPAGNALASPSSPHLSAEIERRRRIVEAIAAGEPADLAPPFAERPPGSRGVAGAACGHGDPGFAAWTCDAGLTCSAVDNPAGDAAVGRCASPGAAGLGEACDAGAIRPGRHARGDRVPAAVAIPCADGLECKTNIKGFPAGQCTGSCDPLPDGGACALIGGDGFNDCLASRAPFTRCVADTAQRIGVPRCGPNRPCRGDYVCVRALDDTSGCLPPYFLFQLRVDGHPRPTPRSGGPSPAPRRP
jgi:hypothetical protein